MQLWRYVWLVALGCALAACAGGSGSSGFDSFPSSENAAIQQALDERRCVERQGLTICPADETRALTPVAPTPTATGTPVNIVDTPAPQRTPTAFPAVTSSPTPTATPRSPASPHKPVVDTAVDASAPIPCVLDAADGSCLFLVPFAPDGFPETAVFRVAVRTLEPESTWTVGSDLSFIGSPTTPVFDAPVAIETSTRAPVESIPVQIAVLAFAESRADVPSEVDELAQTGASFAFVTPQLTLTPHAAP